MRNGIKMNACNIIQVFMVFYLRDSREKLEVIIIIVLLDTILYTIRFL